MDHAWFVLFTVIYIVILFYADLTYMYICKVILFLHFNGKYHFQAFQYRNL